MNRHPFLTFLCACFPGAGQMFAGYPRRGISLMSGFMLLIALVRTTGIELLTVPIPVIWFFAFFDTFTLAGRPAEEREKKPDAFLFSDEFCGHNTVSARRSYRLFGALLILAGVFEIYRKALMPLLTDFLNHLPGDYSELWSVFNKLPSLAVCVFIILFGMRLIRGPKASAADADDMPEYKGGGAE